MFLIYSGHPLGGEELNEQFYAAAGEPKTLWKIADAGHTGGLDTHPEEYEQRVIAFFDRALLLKQMKPRERKEVMQTVVIQRERPERVARRGGDG